MIDTHPEIKNIYVQDLIDSIKNIEKPMYDENGVQILHNTPDSIFKRLDDLENLESIALGKEN